MLVRATRWTIISSTAAIIALMLVATSCGAGCRTNNNMQTKIRDQSTIRITGSLTCLPLLEILSNAYEKKHPNVRFLYLPGAHSPAGIQGAADGTVDIGAVSRGLTAEENKLDLKYTLLSRDGLIVGTHKDLNITDLTAEQIKGIYGGIITNWKDVGGPDAAIVVLDRAEDESAKIVLRQFCLGETAVTSSASVMFLESDMIRALKTTSNSIGYLSYGAFVSGSLPLHAVRINGIQPSVSTIKSGRYQMVRPLAVVHKKNASRDVLDFVKWTRSAEARKLMDGKGYVAA